MSKEEVFEYLDRLAKRGVPIYGYSQAVKDRFEMSYKDVLDIVAEWKEKENGIQGVGF